MPYMLSLNIKIAVPHTQVTVEFQKNKKIAH